jgi:predicted secreted Zn-dependent protease
MRKLDAIIVWFLLLAVASGAQAQTYRCERDGKITFSDRPCEAGAKATQKFYATSVVSGVLDLQIAVTYYAVQGHDYGSLARSLRANGPKGFHGLARWNVTYKYTTKRQRDACQIATVRIKVSGEILMPRWADEPSAPQDLQRRWSDYYAALKRHEDGHIQHGRELALLVKERLMGLGAVPCDDMQTLAQAEFQRVYGNLKARDQEYDARTNHGTTQGAVFSRPSQ